MTPSSVTSVLKAKIRTPRRFSHSCLDDQDIT